MLWGNWVIIPAKLRSWLISKVHKDHTGASHMKSVTQSYFWYLVLDSDIENSARSCISCQAVKSVPLVAPLHSWLWPVQPWQLIHIDFVGPFIGKHTFSGQCLFEMS